MAKQPTFILARVFSSAAVVCAALLLQGCKPSLPGDAPGEATVKKYGEMVKDWNAKLPTEQAPGVKEESIMLREEMGVALVVVKWSADSQEAMEKSKAQLEHQALKSNCMLMAPAFMGARLRYEWWVAGKFNTAYEFKKSNCMELLSDMPRR